MDISEETVNGKVVVALGGQIDSTASQEFEEKILEILDRGVNTLTVDFQNVKFISSAGLRVLLLAAQKVKPLGGKVVLCSMSKDVREVFDISGFSSIFSIYDNVDEALGKI